MLSSPGCWALYGSILAWKGASAGGAEATLTQRIADSYAVQHATNPDRRNRQSVAGHLMSLCASLEHDVCGTRLRRMFGEWTHREYPLLVPRPVGYRVTARDVVHADERSRPAVVDNWAASAWAAWSAHHGTIRAWLATATSRNA